MSLAFLVMVATSNAALAQATQPAETTTRVYDIRDLLITIPNFPFRGKLGMPEREHEAGSGGGGGSQALFGGGGGSAAQRSLEEVAMERQGRVDEVTKLVMETVQLGSWRDSGGKVGALRELSGQLVVTHTPQTHELISSLLSQLRSNSGLVRVQADWIVLSPPQVAGLLAPAGKGADAPRIIDRAALTKLAGETTHFRGEISCFTGQTVSLSSGRSRTVIYDGEPVVAQNAVAVNPDVRQVYDGAMLEVTPLVTGGAADAIVQVNTAFAEWNPPSKAEMTYSSTQPGGSNVQGPTAIDRLDIVRQDLRSTLRIPLNQPVLVGGMTIEPRIDAPQGSQLYLILQVNAAR